MVKEELCEKMVEVCMVSDRVMSVVVFVKDVLRMLFGYALKSGHVDRHIDGGMV